MRCGLTMRTLPPSLFLFFQAEDGIRDHCVTGVQTCALPICLLATSLTQEHITQWLTAKEAWGPTTKNKVIGILRQAFKFGTDQGRLPRNPAAFIKKPRARRRERILSAAEHQAIWKAAR